MRIAVIGLGAMGAAAARVLARRGHEVIGLDRYEGGGALGSSGSGSRIFRLAYTEPDYVELAVEALSAWRGLERDARRELLFLQGLVERGAEAVACAANCRAAGFRVDELDPAASPDCFPELAPRPDVPAFFHHDAGYVLAQASIRAQLAVAAEAGATIVEGERVLSIEPHADGAGASVRSEHRTVEVDVAIVALGVWTSQLLEPLGINLPLTPGLAQVSYFGEPDALGLRPSLIDWDDDEALAIYALPTPGRGYKVGSDVRRPFSLDDTARVPDPDIAAQLAAHVAGVLPCTEGRSEDSEACPWTTTPDEDFVLDRVGPVVVAGGDSGHAFKFSPLLGELLAGLAEEDRLPRAAERCRIGSRFSAPV